MKRRKVPELWKALTRAGELGGNTKFAGFISKNKIVIKDEITTLDDMQKPSASWKEYEKEIIQLRTDGIEDNKSYEKLNKKYKDVIAERQKQFDDYEIYLNEESEIDESRFRKLPEVDLHKDMTGNDDFTLRALGLIIEG